MSKNSISGSANTGWALTDIKDEGDELLDGAGEGGAAGLQGQLPVRHLALLNLQRVHLPRNLSNNSYLCTYDLYGTVCNVFDACRTITRASERGWSLEIETFLGSVKWHRAVRRVPFGAQKSRSLIPPSSSEGAESEGENQWGPSRRGRCRGGGVGGGQSVGAK
jgi:hypothetical protein